MCAIHFLQLLHFLFTLMNRLNEKTELLFSYFVGYLYFREIHLPEARGNKTFSYSTQLSMKFQLLIKFKMLKNKDFSCLYTLRPQGYKTFSCSTQLSTKFILLINVKMPTIVGILTFVSRINTQTKSLTARKIINFQHFSFDWQSAELCTKKVL